MKLVRSFCYAFGGIFYCIRTERNFRVHLTAAVGVLLFSVLYGLENTGYPPLILTIALVMALEAVNTGVERAVDLETSDSRPLAKAAKDAAAAAVLIGAVAAVAVAFFTFSDTDKLLAALLRLRSAGVLAGFIVYAAAGLWFIFGFGRHTKEKGTKK
ncbi:diacylglycerol kinase family protein [Ructibacterium gallinarum]|uniref:Diacylglycerol kinase family protein n=1 Tax=Ructibacterium gallinarum TaxID=2779355 RepID=A0A9D5M0K8_9FIRM|nr:diacylglycerol kinase family protein [Ructibacterium gallinarum]MBE5040065.1 diacylglycerol kinase family protein [Ructibacterium gallinarum]